MPAVRSCALALSLGLLWLGLSGCYPSPEFVRKSDDNAAPAGKSILHASYRNEDPLGLFPAHGRWTVRRVDGQEYPDPVLWELVNRIPLDPGTHAVLLEDDWIFGKSWWHSFEIQAMPGYQYELSSDPGCDRAFGDDVIGKGYVNLTLTGPDQRREPAKVLSICAFGEDDPGCGSDADCRDGLTCVKEVQGRFGLCGRLPE